MERISTWREPCLACATAACAGAMSPSQDGADRSGILNLDKPSGMTSHDVVDRIRAASGVRRVGHAGTLDPAATGVLLVCVGQATRVTEHLMEGRKTYDAIIHLGLSTDTDDAEGQVVCSKPAVDIRREHMLEALSRFEGRIEQVPPRYSALKHRGQPLHRLARRGVEVERQAREVEIYDLRLVEWAPPLARLLVECSKGTYIRALARDLGEELGTGAHLAQLTRLSSGRYTLEDAVSLLEAERCLSTGRGLEILHPLDEALLSFQAFQLEQDAAERVGQGQQVAGPEPTDGPLCRAYGPDGRLVALLQYDREDGVWRPRKVFRPHATTA